jgi:NAD(P)-dependent dehydrogenase (short-subunit alcohol dehydrogenase family)
MASARRVVVTGGSRGIGRAIVSRFASLGDEVVAVGRDREALEAVARQDGPGVTVRCCNLTDESAVDALMAEIGAVDVLVNNAGSSDSAPLQHTTLDSWNSQMAINATAVFLCTRAVITGMRERNQGRLVTIASTAGRAGAPYTSAYSASKHAAVGLMRAVAAELAGTQVTANAVCPAFVDTEMTQLSAARISERTGRSLDQSFEALAKLSPLGRLVDPEEVADAVVWLASAQAGAINGQTIVLDGGGIQT